ncbi:MAG: hypothetical protein AAFX87_15550, partial [Bacteroidota bacterium]
TFFFQRAISLITEKEIKKRSDYYQEYSRRDLRTGKFGIKLSDVHVDLENRVQTIESEKAKIDLLKTYYDKSVTSYQSTYTKYKSIQQSFEGTKQFYLRSGDNTIKELEEISESFDSCMVNFAKYKTVLSSVENTNYNQEITKNEIISFLTDGSTEADFTKNDLNIWDYKKWAEESKSIITGDIKKIKENLVIYDQELEKLLSKVRNDSVSVESDLAKLTEQLLSDLIKKYDAVPQPMPLLLFDLKMAELNYLSHVMATKDWRDSLDIDLQSNILLQDRKKLNSLDSVVNVLIGIDIIGEAGNYKEFVEQQYTTFQGLQKFAKDRLDFAIDEKRRIQDAIEANEKRAMWILFEGDSIPLFEVEKFVFDSAGMNYLPLVITDKFSMGIHFNNDTLPEGYIVDITPSRKPELVHILPLDTTYFGYEYLYYAKGQSLTLSDSSELFVFHSDRKTEAASKVYMQLVKPDKQVDWIKNIDLASPLNELIYQQDEDVILIRFQSNNEEGGEATESVWTLDRQGNLKTDSQ